MSSALNPSTSFWQQLSLPIIGLSPMDGVTDQPYRFIQKKYGSPVVLYTEFTSVEGVCHGALKLLEDFLYDETQRPVVAQIYGTTPASFRQTAILLCELGFDGIDINMGCPAKNVAHSGAGAALIKTPHLAQEIVRETKAGVTDWLNGISTKNCPDISEKIREEVQKRHQLLPQPFQARRPIPVSVKTRIGYDQPVIHDWISTLLETEPEVIALHGRTLTQHYSGEASWENIAKATQLTKSSKTLLLGNGDIKSRADAHEKITTYQTDGALIGRASFGNPFVFTQTPPTPELLLPIALEHAKLFEQIYQNKEKYSFMPMRKHLGWYVRNFPGASEVRVKLFQASSSEDVVEIFKFFNLS
jgi:tRNA-dihydrouridine synthase B